MSLCFHLFKDLKYLCSCCARSISRVCLHASFSFVFKDLNLSVLYFHLNEKKSVSVQLNWETIPFFSSNLGSLNLSNSYHYRSNISTLICFFSYDVFNHELARNVLVLLEAYYSASTDHTGIYYCYYYCCSSSPPDMGLNHSHLLLLPVLLQHPSTRYRCECFTSTTATTILSALINSIWFECWC